MHLEQIFFFQSFFSVSNLNGDPTHTILGFPAAAAAAAAAAVKLLLLLLLLPSDLLKHRLQHCNIYAVICAAIAWNLFRL